MFWNFPIDEHSSLMSHLSCKKSKNKSAIIFLIINIIIIVINC